MSHYGDDLTCADLVELVTDYLDGAMSSADRSRFERHIVTCGGCAIYLDQMRSTIEHVGRLREDDVTPEARDALLHTFRGWKRGDAVT